MATFTLVGLGLILVMFTQGRGRVYNKVFFFFFFFCPLLDCFVPYGDSGLLAIGQGGHLDNLFSLMLKWQLGMSKFVMLHFL
jgi:hypothetical protein